MPRRGWVVILAVCAMPLTTWSQTRVGSEFQANSSTSLHQLLPKAAVDADGNFVVVWSDYIPSESSPSLAVHGQSYDADGVRRGGEFHVNPETVGAQAQPSVAFDSSGGFVVAWTDARFSSYGIQQDDVFAQRFDAFGMPRGSEFRVNSYTTYPQQNPSIASDASGNFVIVWESLNQDGFGWGVFGQRYDPSGAQRGAEFRVNVITTYGNQRSPTVAAWGDGRFAVVWEGPDGDGSYDVFGEFYDGSGLPSGDIRVNSSTTGYQHSPAIAAAASGNFTVVWESLGQDGSENGVFGSRFNSIGNRIGGEFRVNSYITLGQHKPDVAASADGSFVVVWGSGSYASHGPDGSQSGVFGQRYDAAAVAVGAPFQVNTYTTSSQGLPSIASQANGNFVVAWQSYGQDGSGYGVFGQRFEPLQDLIFKDGFDTIECPPPPEPCFPL